MSARQRKGGQRRDQNRLIRRAENPLILENQLSSAQNATSGVSPQKRCPLTTTSATPTIKPKPRQDFQIPYDTTRRRFTLIRIKLIHIRQVLIRSARITTTAGQILIRFTNLILTSTTHTRSTRQVFLRRLHSITTGRRFPSTFTATVQGKPNPRLRPEGDVLSATLNATLRRRCRSTRCTRTIISTTKFENFVVHFCKLWMTLESRSRMFQCNSLLQVKIISMVAVAINPLTQISIV